MAKKDKKKSSGRSDSVRAAVDQAFQATAEQAETARGRAGDIVDELTQVASRFRDVLDELRPPSGDDLKGISEQLAALERRVTALESARTPAAKPAAKPAARRRPPAKTSSRAKPKASQAKATEAKTAEGADPSATKASSAAQSGTAGS